jgi:hypothetical protein
MKTKSKVETDSPNDKQRTALLGFASRCLGVSLAWLCSALSGLWVQWPTAPQIITGDSNFGVRSNHFGFDFAGPTNSTIVVESSPDLSSWTPLATNTIESGLVYFSELIAGPRAFYRLRLLQ